MRKLSKLYVCPTPIGNLEDITLRAIRVLGEADMIAAEDTRRTVKLLNHLEIKKPLVSLHQHNENHKSDELVSLIKEGKVIALVSDAGMPGISDPGHILIKKCIENDVEIIVLPGACAFIVALVASGLSTESFTFLGFLDRNHKTRISELEKYKQYPHTLIFYEAPHRIKHTLMDIYQVMGDRKITIARELTKKFEQYIRSDVKALIENIDEMNLLGEFVIILEGGSEQAAEEISEQQIYDELKALLDEDYSTKDASKKIAEKYKLKKNDVYSIALTIK